MRSGDLSRIGGLSKATGVKVETIRWYEQVGLLPPPRRTAGNCRIYGDTHFRRLAFIRRARELGFPLEKVRELLLMADQVGQPCLAVDVIAREHLEEIDRKIAGLQEMRRELGAIVDGGCPGRVSDCRVLEALVADEGRGGH